MFDIIKNILIPAVKDEIRKTCVEAVECTLYHKSIDLSESVPVPYDYNRERIRVIGPIITKY